MLHPNRCDLDFAEIDARITHIRDHRRRLHPLDQAPRPPALPAQRHGGGRLAAWRERIRALPLLGTFAQRAYRWLRGIAAPGLPLRARIRLIPGLGPFAYGGYCLLKSPHTRALALGNTARLNELQTRFERLEYEQIRGVVERLEHLERRQDQQTQVFFERLEHLERRQDQQTHVLFQRLEHLERRQDQQTHVLAERLERLEDMAQQAIARIEQERIPALAAGIQDELGTLRQQLAVELCRLSDRMAGLAAAEEELSTSLREQIRAVRLLEGRAPTPALPTVQEMPVPADNVPGSFYIDFEDHFRGSPEAIAERLRPYLDLLEENGLTAPAARVLDIGCGRGEWLALLQQQGYRAQGVDLNPAMAESCRDLGLDVQCTSAEAHLAVQPEAGYDVITAFHVIEHLSLPELLDLFDRALRALRPGGLVIFETPNPENLQVGACNFYMDPTHKHPIPPAVADFIARQRGYARTRILRLHPYPEDHLLPGADEIASRLNQFLYGPQDYALIAWK